MSRYKMPIMIVALLLISGVLGNHVYQTRITYSLHDLVMDYVNEAKIESIFLKKFMSGDNEGNNYAHITDNKQIELVMNTLQDIGFEMTSRHPISPITRPICYLSMEKRGIGCPISCQKEARFYFMGMQTQVINLIGL